MQTPEYQELFPDTRLKSTTLNPDEKQRWKQTTSSFEVVGARGVYRSIGVLKGITGFGAKWILADDLVKGIVEADSELHREKLFKWFFSDLMSRLESDGRVCIINTRWHQDDICGKLLALEKADQIGERWTVLIFREICEHDNEFEYDPRKAGEVLWPERYPLANALEQKPQMALRIWFAVWQQNPTPEDGNIIKRSHFRFYMELPSELQIVIQAWDGTFDKTKKSDFVAGAILGSKGANIYIIDLVHARMGFSDWVKAILALSEKWPQALSKYIEKAANGAALIDVLQDSVPGLIPIIPTGSKIARVNAVSPRFEAGNIWLPLENSYPWVRTLIEEFVCFPNHKNDDIVDAVVHGIMKLAETKPMDYLPVSLGQVNIWKY